MIPEATERTKGSGLISADPSILCASMQWFHRRESAGPQLSFADRGSDRGDEMALWRRVCTRGSGRLNSDVFSHMFTA
jgi:hypothetical protein